MPNRSTEDYIKAVYALEASGEPVTTSAVASQLHIANGSVSAMLKKLSRERLLHYKPYQGVTLTATGRRMALKIVRRHRLWEVFLARRLGFPWDAVHDEAERLEHVTSDLLERKLDESLGFPLADPHGDPIPSAAGNVRSGRSRPLAACSQGDRVEIVRVSDRAPALLRHATKLGLGLRARVTVKELMSFDGSMVVKVGAHDRFISKEMSEAIFVRPE
jgi:DtxR family transcriptional regulator, Mn-dependent transcriptional regulator